MARWGIGEELSEKVIQGDTKDRVLAIWYASDEVWAAMLAFPEAVKDSGDTAFERAHGMNLYNYMYRAE